MDAGGARVLRGCRHRVGARDRFRGARAGRRGRGRHLDLHPRGTAHAQRPSDGRAHRPGRVCRGDHPRARRPGRSCAPAPCATPPRGVPPTPSAGSRWRSAGCWTTATRTVCSSRRARTVWCVRSCSSSRGGQDGMSLDVMRRDSTAQAGVNELMIVEALKAAPSLGVTPGVAELRGLPVRARAWREAGRRPDPADLATDPAHRLAVAPDREPLPVQRQVPAPRGSRGSSSIRPGPTCRGSASPPSRQRRS